MINKLAKAQKSWIAKLILILTSLSFMSLFGISGYLSSASNNRTVIKVDNVKVSQAEFSYAFQKELNAAKNLMDIDFNDEANENLRSSLMNVVAQKMIHDAVIDRTAQKYHVSFRSDLIGQIIKNEPSFKDMAGRFNSDLFRRVLAENNISESEYTQSVVRGMVEQLLVNWPVRHIKVPQILSDAELKVDNKRRTFKYVIVKPDETTINREMTEDEIEQYYEDFAPSFVAPETRDLSVIYLSIADILSRMDVSDEEIKAYYDEHIDDYEEKEKRHVLQMMFDNVDAADEAYYKLKDGIDFYEVASSDASQTKEDTDLGLVKEDELVFEIAEDTFALSQGEYTKPIQVGDAWQIVKVTEIVAPTKVDYAKAAKEIREELLNEGLYDEIYDVLSKIEDNLGEGKTLEEIAPAFNTKVLKVVSFAEDGSVTQLPAKLEDVMKTTDVRDAAFSYALGETSQTIEADEGLVVLRVDNIIESHQKDMASVIPEIKEMWTLNERTAMAQEMVNDIMHDLENGEDLAKSARRYGLHVYKSQPITRNEVIAGLDYATVRELFMQNLNEPYQAVSGEDYVILVADSDYPDLVPAGEDEKSLVLLKLQQNMERDLQKAMTDSYAKDYKIDVKYKLMGFED